MGALDGLKILDFSTLLPGPYASLILADLGAEVLRISAPGRRDIVEEYGPAVEGTDTSACAAWLGRNKKTMYLDLKTPEGKAIVKELVKEYDIVLEQFRPGVMDSLDIGYEDLKAVNPAVIFCSLTGYGQTGPLRDAAGHDINYISRSGIISHAGRRKEGPALMNFQIADVAVGSMNSVVGILAAVHYRHETGQGQRIDVAMLDGCIPFNSLDGAGFLASGRQPQPEGELLNGGSVYDYYRTKDGRYLSVGSLEPKFWEAFCRGIGREDLIAGTVCPPNVEEVKAQIRGIFLTRTLAEWMDVFSEYDACVQPVLDLSEALLEDEQIRAREMVVEVGMPLDEGVKARQFGNPIKLSECPSEYKHAGYPTGWHTRAVIEELGLDYEELEAKGVFGERR